MLVLAVLIGFNGTRGSKRLLFLSLSLLNGSEVPEKMLANTHANTQRCKQSFNMRK
jgi:hypothetical protein